MNLYNEQETLLINYKSEVFVMSIYKLIFYFTKSALLVSSS